MNRRSFIKGLAVAPIAAALPVAMVSEPIVVGIDMATADDMCTLVAYREFQIQEICHAFAVPRHLLGSAA